jgi:hypothetical protein
VIPLALTISWQKITAQKRSKNACYQKGKKQLIDFFTTERTKFMLF